jgi:uncharacterized iron-regulated membrane protein
VTRAGDPARFIRRISNVLPSEEEFIRGRDVASNMNPYAKVRWGQPGLQRLILVTHRWLGLASSIVLSIVGMTGAVLAWPGRSLVHRIAGRFHETLALGSIGWWLVVIATMAAVILQIGGLLLWWKRKRIAVQWKSGWRQGFSDLHHAAGILWLPLMAVLAVSGVAMAFVTPDSQPELRRVVFAVHTARSLPTPIKLLYTVGTTGFLIQGITGVVMWWRTR